MALSGWDSAPPTPPPAAGQACLRRDEHEQLCRPEPRPVALLHVHLPIHPLSKHLLQPSCAPWGSRQRGASLQELGRKGLDAGSGMGARPSRREGPGQKSVLQRKEPREGWGHLSGHQAALASRPRDVPWSRRTRHRRGRGAHGAILFLQSLSDYFKV